MIHISKATRDALTSSYDVIQGNGGSRDQYLADNKIETFLIGMDILVNPCTFCSTTYLLRT
jgi:hypothetical protein